MIAMNLQEEYFKLINSGEKIYEIRLNDEKRQQLDVGDIIEFINDGNKNQRIALIVRDLIYFDSFSEMLDVLPLNELGFSNQSKEKAYETYRAFYSQKQEQKYKVVAIKL